MARASQSVAGRPRFVATLVVGAFVVMSWKGWRWAVLGSDAYVEIVFGRPLRGEAATLALLVRAVVYAIGCWGLWRMRAWARWLAMVYLAAEIAGFLVFGARAFSAFAGWALVLLPYAVFNLMYLQRAGKEFR